MCVWFISGRVRIVPVVEQKLRDKKKVEGPLTFVLNAKNRLFMIIIFRGLILTGDSENLS